LAVRTFFDLGAVVIFPGRAGLRDEAFLALVALATWIFLDADERLFDCFVIKLLIGFLTLRMNHLHCPTVAYR
jgi:hypothetical protein